MYGTMVVVGFVVLATAGLLALGDVDRLSERMPTQVPPRRMVWRMAGVGAAILVIGLVGVAVG